jgi:hypothetical protein
VAPAAGPADDQAATPAERGRSRAATRATASTAGASAVAIAAAPGASTAADAAVAATAAIAAVDGPDGSVAALDVAVAAGPADRVVAEALNRIRTTVQAGVPGLESRIDDPQLGSIRVLVSGRPGETIRAELVAADPAAARELTAALERAVAGGATLPAGVDLHVRTDSIHRPSAADAHLGSGANQGGRTNPDGQAPDRRGDDGGTFGFGQASAGGGHEAMPEPRNEPRADHQPHGRERRPDPVPAARAATPIAVRNGAALDVRA